MAADNRAYYKSLKWENVRYKSPGSIWLLMAPDKTIVAQVAPRMLGDTSRIIRLTNKTIVAHNGKTLFSNATHAKKVAEAAVYAFMCGENPNSPDKYTSVPG